MLFSNSTTLESPTYNLLGIENNRHAGELQSFEREQAELETGVRWSWSCRHVDQEAAWYVDSDASQAPKVGDVAVIEVKGIANHTSAITAENEKMRIYEGDRIVCVFGNRYATDAFEGETQGTEVLHLMTAGGMIGTVQAKHTSVKNPTKVKFIGFLSDEEGKRLNLKEMSFSQKRKPLKKTRKIIFAVGSGMNSGKTTTASRMVRGLVQKGVRVAACKLTGSVSHRDLFEMRATSPVFATDFSDYGFPSTYLCEEEELLDLFHTMVADCDDYDPDVIVMEIADGVLQRETQFLLNHPEVKKYVSKILLTAPCALSANQGVQVVRNTGNEPMAVSGIISNSPLFIREFRDLCDVPFCTSIGDGSELADTAIKSVAETAR